MLGVSSAAVPASLRRTNQRTVLSLLLRLGSASRADLAKAAGLSQPTAGKIIDELLRRGLLCAAQNAGESAKTSAPPNQPRLGRPGQLLALDADRPRFIALELGVLETRLAALPIGVKLFDEWAWRFSTPDSPGEWLRRLRKTARNLPRQGLWGVLVSVPGIVDETAGKVLYSPNLHWLERVDLASLLRGAFELPLVLVQEIRALALGHFGVDQEVQDFLLVDFGEGVGGAIVLEGKPYPHPTPLSGELGHAPVPGNRRPCGCGARGCLETLMSERGLLESFGQATGMRRPSWDLFKRRVSERGLEPWLAEALDATARVIVGALNVLGLHRVVMTGRLTDLPKVVPDYLFAEVGRGALWARFGAVECCTAPRRRAAGLVAAGLDRLVMPNEVRSPKLEVRSLQGEKLP